MTALPTEIRRGLAQDAGDVMSFIDAHWKKGHVLSTDRRLFDWQYQAEDGTYNIVLARQGDRLLGILGYIPASRYDPDLAVGDIVWLALWKVREDAGQPGLGLRLLQHLTALVGARGLAVNGINPSHPPMYKALRYQVAELRQYFLAHPSRQAPLISRTEGRALPVPEGQGAIVIRASSVDLARMQASFPVQGLPGKTPEYFSRRFLHHPSYRYQVHAIQGPGGAQALMASRVATHGEHQVLRVVDFSGDEGVIAHMGAAFLQLMDEHHAGHVDFWQHGLPDAMFKACGFLCAQDMPDIAVPNFYEPFHPATGRILCAFKVDGAQAMRVFRADGDQDRPNQPADVEIAS